ncbi:MAG: gamma carbonic anhydrase family protein [Candidatus Omnitrophota bacterium]
MILPFKGKTPKIHPSVFIAPGAHVIGDVTLARGANIWFTAVIRGDIAPIRIGEGTNIQDGCVVHVDRNLPCILKNKITMGHQATAHACVVEEGVLVGIGARILSGARVGAYSLIGAGAVVLENARIPARSLVLGLPGKVVRRLSAKETAWHDPWARRYVELASAYRKYLG